MSREEPLKLRSCITKLTMQRALFKGTLLAILGMTPMILGGTLFSSAQLSGCGLLFFSVGFGLIALGLIPYRRLCALERSPYILHLDESGKLSCQSKGKRILNLPVEEIKQISFVNKRSTYGIVLTLKRPLLRQITIYHRRWADQFLFPNKRLIPPCDLFFPYFSKRSFLQLVEFVNDGNAP